MATFEISVQNPSKHTLTYDIKVKDNPSDSWDVSLDTEQVVIEPKQSKLITLTVKPSDFVKHDDWVQIRLLAKPVKRKKTADISTITTIKEGKVQLSISNVYHWPRVFKKGDRVVTSFKLRNIGNISAHNVTVILYLNGKEKNKVEDVTIPRGGYADIEMPWIAVKSKNEINIVVR
jgi:hypothetical protein